MILRSTFVAVVLLLRNTDAPTLSSLSPSTVVAGDVGFWLTVNGSGLEPGSVVRMDDVERTTTRLSSTTLAAMIAAVDIAHVGVRRISVATPDGELSASQTLSVVTPPPSPTLLSIAPSIVRAGGPAFRLVLHGSDFRPTSLVEVDGVERATFDATATSLVIDVRHEDLHTPGTRRIRVVTPPPGGGVSSILELKIRE